MKNTLTEKYRTEKQQAELEGVSLRTLRRRRALREGPPWLKIGARVYYPIDSFDAWLESRIIHPIREAA